MAEDNAEKGKLKRVIGTMDVFAISVATVISGIFFGWNYGLGITGPFGFLIAILFSFVFYGLVLMCDSELGSSLPKTGGEYLFAERAMGGMAGTITAAYILLTSITGLSSVAMGFASYLHSISGFLNESIIAIISIAIVMILAILNIKFSSKVQLIITSLAIAVIAVFIIISGINNQGVTMYTNPVPIQGGFLGFLMAIPFGMWFFIGCDTTIGLAEELKNPGKSLPKGFLFSILTLLAVALLVWWASVGIMPWEELGAADAPIIVAIWNIAPPIVITLINIASIASLFGTLLGLMLYSSRILFAVARDGYLPRAFGFLQPKFTSPYISVL
ncbi:MAG: amino acid permease, partial [Actinomycetota bacterium]|nr:amino acid permease [Actinomycetota bacterium]